MRTLPLGPRLALATWAALAMLVSGCSANDSSPNAGVTPADPEATKNGATSGSSSDVAPSAGPTSGAGIGTGGDVPATQGQGGAGVLTAGLWDDRLNYDFFGKYLDDMHANGVVGAPDFARADFDAAHGEFAQRTARTVVDAALVIDTTGSMGDEIAYLTAEFSAISDSIKAQYPNADQRWALVVYRDRPDTDPGDAYVVNSFDFTGDAKAFTTTLSRQQGSGGGDYEEAPEVGLAKMHDLGWRSGDSVAKLAFWVGDAPQHTQYSAAMKQAIVDAHAAGIHLYPVSASGTNDVLELTMRSAAEITGGRYLFLTDDSGVGDAHKTPRIPCYFVTKLSKALVRSVGMELTGKDIAPDPADILRTTGSPSKEGACAVDGGGTVQIL